MRRHLRLGLRCRPWLLSLVSLLLPAVLLAPPGADAIEDSLAEANFTEALQSTKSALVAFVVPWCAACRAVMQELDLVRNAMALHRDKVLIAEVDVSRELVLAERYRAWRTPVVLLFPDTRVLAAGLQIPFVGQLQHKIVLHVLMNALSAASKIVLPQVQAVSDVKPGAFLGFFRSGDTDSEMQDLWNLDCLRRQGRGFALAHGLAAAGEAAELWQWAGLRRRSDAAAAPGSELLTEEAIVFVPPSSSDEVPAGSELRRFQFGLGQAGRGGQWRDEVDRFCTWCERQVLGPVAFFDPARAAALDGTFEWILLLFAPRASTGSGTPEEPQQLFAWERERLARLAGAATAADASFGELLPVIVPRSFDEAGSFRMDMGLPLQHPPGGMPREASSVADAGGAAPSPACAALRAAPAEGPWGSGGGDRGQRRFPEAWAVVLYNTRTRRRYLEPSNFGWLPGEEVALCDFAAAALSGRLPPHVKSSEPLAPRDGADGGSGGMGHPTGLLEVVGKTFGGDIVEPIRAGEAEALLFIYAPWCAHSLSFFPLWHTLVEGLTADAAAAAAAAARAAVLPAGAAAPGGAGVPQSGAAATRHLILAQMDGTRNEHAALPFVSRFPTLMRVMPSGGADDGTAEAGLRYETYGGTATAQGLAAWLAAHPVGAAAAAPPPPPGPPAVAA